MIARTITLSALAVVLAGPGLAGPCTQRIAELEKATSARHEGGGPALANPSTTGSTAPAASSSGVTATDHGATQIMQMLQQAKQLDQQGKEAECMDLATRAGAMAPAGTK